MNSRISSEVSRGSQSHQVPQLGCPQKAPVQRARKVKMAPVGATAAPIMKEIRVLKTSPMADQPASTTYNHMDIQAAGTWMKMMR